MTGTKLTRIMVFIRGRGRASIIYALGLILSFCIGCGSGEPSVGERTVSGRTGLTGIEDLNGHPVDPLAHMTNKAEVFVFVATDCPISNRYAPELRRLAEKFKANGVRFRLVYPNADDSSPLIQKHVADFSLSMPVIRDLEHTLVRTAKVRVTPEAAVFLPDGTLIYHGRIDDQYVDFGKDRPEPTQRDLQQVLTDLLAGRRLTESSTRAVGCNIPER